MSMSMKKFQSYVVHISDDLKDSDERSHQAWKFPALFNPLPSNIDPPYLGK